MHDSRWPQLKRLLQERGWMWRNGVLYAPHETLWFETSEDPDYAAFQDGASGRDVDHAALHADLVSLVEALDAVLAN